MIVLCVVCFCFAFAEKVRVGGFSGWLVQREKKTKQNRVMVKRSLFGAVADRRKNRDWEGHGVVLCDEYMCAVVSGVTSRPVVVVVMGRRVWKERFERGATQNTRTCSLWT